MTLAGVQVSATGIASLHVRVYRVNFDDPVCLKSIVPRAHNTTHTADARGKVPWGSGMTLYITKQAIIRTYDNYFRTPSTWGPRGQGVSRVKTMIKSLGDHQMAPSESYGRR